MADSWYNRSSGSHCRSAGKSSGGCKNPGILRTYFQNLVPDLLNFALQVVIAVIVYAVGAKLIGLIVKIVRKTMERRNADVGVIQFLSAVVKYALYFILILTILSLFGIATTSAVAVLGSCGVAVGLAPRGSLQLCRRSADPLLKPFCGRRLYH